MSTCTWNPASTFTHSPCKTNSLQLITSCTFVRPIESRVSFGDTISNACNSTTPPKFLFLISACFISLPSCCLDVTSSKWLFVQNYFSRKWESLLWKTRAYFCVDQLFEWVFTDLCKRDPEIIRSHQSYVLQTCSTTRENLIVDFSRFEFPADVSTKEKYEKRCTGKLSASNWEPFWAESKHKR